MDFIVKVDDENNAVEWWQWLWETYPTIARSLTRNSCAVLSREVYRAISAGPAFSTGPGHAQDALIDCGSSGDQWLDIVTGPHYCIETLS